MEQTLATAKALADGSRMRVIGALMKHDELCVCQITEMLRLSGATVSRHMTVLQNARLVQSRKDGRWVFYRLVGDFPESLRLWLEESLLESQHIKADQVLLKKILSLDPEEICRQQKERKECNV